MDPNRVDWKIQWDKKATSCRFWIVRGREKCNGKPRGNITLCPTHLQVEFKRCYEKYLKAYDAATAYKELVEMLRREMMMLDIKVVAKTAADVIAQLNETRDLENPPRPDDDTEQLMPSTTSRGRPENPRESIVRPNYPQRRGGNPLSNRPDLPQQWTGHIGTPEEDEAELKRAGFKAEVIWNKPEPEINKEELMGEEGPGH